MKPKQKSQGLSLRNMKSVETASALALTLPGLMFAGGAFAQESYELDTLQIEERTADTNPYAEEGAPYKAKTSGDRRRVKELADTPTTISVLTQTQVQESGKSDLRDILAAQPGISLGTGENGNAFGDRYVIRGHEARSDVFVDSLRDPGMTTRESFAVEQIEITKGPSSTFAGRGSSGGAVNSITKQASTDYDFTKVQAGLGTDSYQRYTLDSNKKLTDDIALRANLLFADEDVPDREPAARERKGAALSGFFQATEKFDFLADYYYLDAEDASDLGTYIDGTTGKPVDDIFAYTQDEDFISSEVEVFTFRLGYQASDNVRIQNATRYGTTDNGYVVTGARGTTGYPSELDAENETNGFSTISFSTHQGWQEVEYFVNQFNLFMDTEFAGMPHHILVGAEYSDLNVLNGNYTNADGTRLGGSADTTNCFVAGRGGVGASHCGIVDGNTVSNLNNLLSRQIIRGGSDSDYSVETLSLSLMDTVDVTDSFTVFAGVRVDDFDYSNVVGTDTKTDWSYSDTLWNWHLGVVYDLSEDGNVYFTYATAANINGGESDLGANCGYGGLCGSVTDLQNSEPEEVVNIELGTKWEFFNEKLLATAAIFQITKSDVMEGVDYSNTGTLNTGENRVEGIEIGLTGNLTDSLSIQFGAAFMDSEILESFYDGVNQYVETRGPNAGTLVTTDDRRGLPLANFAEDSAYLQLRYQATPKLAVGGTATYSSEVYTGQPDTAANPDLGVPDYTVYDLFASYKFNEQLDVRLNVSNVTDEDYYFTAYRSGAFTYIGDARHANVTLSYAF